VYPGDRQPERRLYLNGEEESGELVRSGAPTLAYIAAAEGWLAERTPRGASYLFLGGGAYTLPRRVAERDPRAAITVVELDPEVTRTALRFFGLRREHGIRSVHGDARAFLTGRDGGAFDRIYVDVYGGQESLPHALVTAEALEAMRARLRQGGIAALNVIGTTQGPESTRFWSIARTFATAFPSVALYVHLGRDYPDRQNFLLAGALAADHPFPPRAGLFDLWPKNAWPTPPGVLVYHDLQRSPGTGEEGEELSPLALVEGEE
jgi:predicted membrane-bound spermidine synthase